MVIDNNKVNSSSSNVIVNLLKVQPMLQSSFQYNYTPYLNVKTIGSSNLPTLKTIEAGNNKIVGGDGKSELKLILSSKTGLIKSYYKTFRYFLALPNSIDVLFRNLVRWQHHLSQY